MTVPARLLFTLLLGLCSTYVVSQEYTISGLVSDTSGTPIPYANVVLFTAEDTLVKGAISDDDGSFLINNIPSGDYLLKVSFVGYEDYITDSFLVSENKTLPRIELSKNIENLEEVTVISKNPTIQKKADRLVFNVENSIVSNGSTWDILKKTPGVVVKQGELTVRNESVNVYLNDRKVELSSEEIQSLLESVGGDAINSVEVITNPPAKYDAEGGAILNIVTSKSISIGYKGNITARGTYGIFPKHYFGTSHYFKSKKLNLFFNYSFSPLKRTLESDNFTEYQDQQGQPIANWVQDYERKTWSDAHNANLILDYKVTEKQTLSFSAIGLYSPDVFDFARSQTDVSLVEDPFTIGTTSSIDSDRNNLALDLKYTIDMGNGSLSANAHFTSFSRERLQRLRSLYNDNQGALFRTVSFTSDALQDIEIYTGQIDYETRIGNVQFEAGGKIAAIDSQSKIDFIDINNESVNGLSEAQNDNFLYDENVIAGYVSFGREWGKWSLKGGLRGEQTNSEGNSLVLNVINKLDYFEWFPSVYIQHSPSEKHSFSIDYGRKLDRPRYEDLNPFAYFLNENNFAQGNSGLLPAFANRFNFNYTLSGKYFFDLYYRDNGDNILTLPFQDNATQVLRTERQNAFDSKSWGIDFTHGRSIVKWWYFYTYMSVFHEEETFIAKESSNAIVTNEVDGFYGSFSNFLTFSKDKTFTGEVSIDYFSKFLSGSYVQESTTNFRIGLKKTFWKKRASLSVTVNDILGEANARLTSRYLNQNNGYFAIPETQNVQIGFTYNFGNFKLEDNNRNISKEERDRLQVKQ